MARRNQSQSNDSGIFQKIGLLSDLTNAMTNKELKDAFENLGTNGDRLYEIFAEAVYAEIEYLMKGERPDEEVPQVMADAAQSAEQIYAAMYNLYSMMVSLSQTPAMAPLNLIAEKMTGMSFNPQAAQVYQPQQYAPPQQYQPAPQAIPAGYPAHPHRRGQVPAPEPVYEEPAPAPQPQRPAPRQQQPRQQAPQQPAAPASAPAPQKRRQYGEAPPPQQQPAPQQPQQPARPGPAQTNRPAPRQGHSDPAPTLPPRRNSITGLY